VLIKTIVQKVCINKYYTPESGKKRANRNADLVTAVKVRMTAGNEERMLAEKVRKSLTAKDIIAPMMAGGKQLKK
jgi:hypothetical protein